MEVAAAEFFKCALASGQASDSEGATLLDAVKPRSNNGSLSCDWAYGLLATTILSRDYGETLLGWYGAGPYCRF